jgi:hypothetical protein
MNSSKRRVNASFENATLSFKTTRFALFSRGGVFPFQTLHQWHKSDIANEKERVLKADFALSSEATHVNDAQSAGE